MTQYLIGSGSGVDWLQKLVTYALEKERVDGLRFLFLIICQIKKNYGGNLLVKENTEKFDNSR